MKRKRIKISSITEIRAFDRGYNQAIKDFEKMINDNYTEGITLKEFGNDRCLDDLKEQLKNKLYKKKS